MSLTREQWIEMWNECKEIQEFVLLEDNIDAEDFEHMRFNAELAVKSIKTKIQKVIGQME